MAARQLFSGNGMQLKRVNNGSAVNINAPQAQAQTQPKPANQFANFGNKFLETGRFGEKGVQNIKASGFDPRDFMSQVGSGADKNSLLQLLTTGSPSKPQMGNGPTTNTMFSTLPSSAVAMNTPNLTNAGLAPQVQAQPYAPQQATQPVGSTFDPYAGFDVELGGKGNVKSINGQVIPYDQRKKPGAVNYFGIGAGNALQEGINFEFQDLPQLQGLLDNLYGTASGAYNQGSNLTGLGQNQLLGTAGDLSSTIGSERGIQQQGLSQLNRLQQMGLDPTLSANFQGDLANTLARRQQAVNERFTTGDMADQFGRERGLAIQDLASRGIIDSTTSENVLSNLESKLMRERANQMQTAEELTRQEMLGERTRVGEQAAGFGGLRASQGQTGSATLANLLGIGENIGSSLGGLGVNLQGIGLEGLTNQAQLSQQERDTLADLQLAELNTRLGARQGTLENLFGRRQANRDYGLAQDQLALQKRLVDDQTSLLTKYLNFVSNSAQAAGAAAGAG